MMTNVQTSESWIVMNERGSYRTGVCRGCSLEAQLQQQQAEPPAWPGGTCLHSSSQRHLHSRVRRNALERREDQMRLASHALTGAVSLVLSSDVVSCLVWSSLSSDVVSSLSSDVVSSLSSNVVSSLSSNVVSSLSSDVVSSLTWSPL